MASSSPKHMFRLGARDGVPFILIVFPFGMFVSVVAVELGFSPVQAAAFSVLVIAGAAQFAAMQLMSDGAPVITVVATALAVNLRMAMYSASLAPHLGAAPVWQRLLIGYLNVDQAYAQSMAKYEAEPSLTLREKVAYYAGAVLPVAFMWYVGAFIGAFARGRLPETLSLDAALPIAFVAIVSIMLRTVAHWVAAAVSVVVALLLAGLPQNSGLLVAGVAAMIAGAVVDAWLERRA